ncbi:MAG TPA: 4-(cytidine 5'-diphospho)-2-C-methyl-D-erythritol kinase [Burkholderiales bacterium]|nr:4-(cytidine 5'-diphospho)-2-C-methyl-D-erythritol kinase [Burkholderiales bacterium]
MSDLQTYPAPAKLNLFLHVVGRRADGYHLLQSVFRFLDYGDQLSFRVRDDGVIQRAYNLPAVPEKYDLCVRAAKLLQQTADTRLGAEIVLEKKLPLGGGLGGGSSDAATTLMALNRLWKLSFPREQLQQLGLRLGADVPVFIFGQSAFAEGVGELLQPISLPPAWYVVLVPKVNVSTAEIFADPELTRNTNRIKITAFSTGQVHNDLEPVVCRKYPQVAQHMAWLKQFGAARITGSGACVFAEYATEREAREVLAQLPSQMSGFAARGLDRHPLRDLAR